MLPSRGSCREATERVEGQSVGGSWATTPSGPRGVARDPAAPLASRSTPSGGGLGHLPLRGGFGRIGVTAAARILDVFAVQVARPHRDLAVAAGDVEDVGRLAEAGDGAAD